MMTEWFEGLARRFYVAMHELVPDNTDSRFDGFDGTNKNFIVPVYSQFLVLIATHLPEFYAARTMLDDEASRQQYDDVLLLRMVSHFHFRIKKAEDLSWEGKTDLRESYFEDSPERSEVAHGQLVEQKTLPECELTVEGERYRMRWYPGTLGGGFFGGQYAPVGVCSGDVVIDGGGYVGDTMLPFAHWTGPYGQVFVFEPGIEHLAVCQDTLDRNPHVGEVVKLIAAGLGDRDHADGELMHSGFAPWAKLQPETRVVRLDTLVDNGVIPRVDVLKLDIEGSEMAALRGAEKVLVRDRPRLAICVYHKPTDLYEIPLYLAHLLPDYRWSLGHFSIRVDETVLFGAPR